MKTIFNLKKYKTRRKSRGGVSPKGQADFTITDAVLRKMENDMGLKTGSLTSPITPNIARDVEKQLGLKNHSLGNHITKDAYEIYITQDYVNNLKRQLYLLELEHSQVKKENDNLKKKMII